MLKLRIPAGLLLIVTLITTLSGSDFIRRNGRSLVVGANSDPILLRGVNFNNWWLEPIGGGDWGHHDPDDTGTPMPYAFGDSTWVAAAATMGANVLRLGLTYRLFEDNANPYVYKESGYAVIDQYLVWAQVHNMYLILDMHVPPGGLQNTDFAPGLWTSQDNQDRLVALWKAIATRYADESRIAGYDLLNEPTPVDSIAAYSNLTQRIADSIRVVDQNHMLIVEYTYGLMDSVGTRIGNWDLSKQMFLINDDNTMYDFHYYSPIDYTLQCYGNPECPDGVAYGDSTVDFEAQNWVYMPVSRDYLEYDFPKWLEFSITQNVPVNVGEWAPWEANFNYNNNALGGYEYICDLLDIMDQYQVSWQYYCYNEYKDIPGLNTRLSNFLKGGSCSPNAPPAAVVDTVTMDEDAVLTVYVLANDSDPELASLKVQSMINSGTHGLALKDVGDTTITYTPEQDYFGPDTLEYVITDGYYADTATVYVTINNVNDAPVAFALLTPAAGTLIHRINEAIWDTVVFSWERSLDVEGDSVTYHFTDISDQLLFDTQPTSDTVLYLIPGIGVLGINNAFVDTFDIVWSVTAHDANDSTVATNGPLSFVLVIDYTNLSVTEDGVLPTEFALHQNYPNPFNPTTLLQYDLPEESYVRLMVYDIMGREVIRLVDEVRQAGQHQVRWAGLNMAGQQAASGIYFARLITLKYTKSMKMLLLK